MPATPKPAMEKQMGFPNFIVPVETSDGDLLYTINQVAEAYENGMAERKAQMAAIRHQISRKDAAIAKLIEALEWYLPDAVSFEGDAAGYERWSQAADLLAKHKEL